MPLLFFLFFCGCGYHTELGKKDSSVLMPGTRVALTEIVNPSLRPELNILFRSDLCQEMAQQAGVFCAERQNADFLARLEIKEFLEDAALKGLDDRTERFAIRLAAELILFHPHDMSRFWSSGLVEIKESYQHAGLRSQTIDRSVRLACEEMTSRLFHAF